MANDLTSRTPHDHPLSDPEIQALDAHWRALAYLSAGQLYLRANPLLREPLRPEHVKPRVLGHWGTCPGLALLYTHLNRLITTRGTPTMAVWGPGHGAAAVLAGAWMEGTYGELWPDVSRDATGMERLFAQFSQPGGVPSHTSPEVPGSVQEGGELGYALSHAFGAAFDNPDLLVCAVIGDGEAETGPLAASWQATTFLDPVHDGAVLPVLHLNGYKIANPTVLARLPERQLVDLLRGYGWEPLFVTADLDTPRSAVHHALAGALDTAAEQIETVRRRVRASPDAPREQSHWPLLVLRTPKGWSGPREVDGLQIEGTSRAHQVPLSGVREDEKRLRELEDWLRSYRPEQLFDHRGQPRPQALEFVPGGDRRLGSVPQANGGRLLRRLPLPPLEPHAVPVERPGASAHEPTRVLGAYLEQLMRATEEERDFRLFGPDETDSNRLSAVWGATDRGWQAEQLTTDEHLGRHGRVLEVLSEHLCEGWLEGYVLTGRHGLFASYEAFTNLVSSMVSQHVKWVHSARRVPWRRPVAALNHLLTSHAWRQDHNGFSHQDPGFIDHVLSKSPDVVRVYLPPDTNTLLCVTDHALRTRDTMNVIVAGKNSCFDWLGLEDARDHCARGLGIWEWAGTEGAGEPDVVLACAGDVPTQETLATADLLREWLPDLAVRVVNVVDVARLMSPSEHPHGLSDADFDTVFTRDRPVIFAYHGYPWLVHRLTYSRAVHDQLVVRGYRESGTTTTPFDMVVRNGMDRYHLVRDVVDRTEGLGARAATVRQRAVDMRERHRRHVLRHGTDLPEVADWHWSHR
ncbi:phosphoketolase family protein [Streptomyces sp. NPDC005438]|uniref:phosphoketolase family protein n=1 Tax=Streptomyces sp. NPDC005438 TaxID=3156880 RepID=UPI0033A1F060